MPYPDRLLGDDEEVVRHLHPHWVTILPPVVVLMLVVGGASFCAAIVPVGPNQGMVRLGIVGTALLLLLVLVVVPLLRWRTSHYVVTSHRLLVRNGLLVRRGRDVGLSRIVDVSYRQTLEERIVGTGTLSVVSAGGAGPTVLRRIPDVDGVQQLINHMIDEDADRRVEDRSAARGGPYVSEYEFYADDHGSYVDDHEPGRRR